MGKRPNHGPLQEVNTVLKVLLKQGEDDKDPLLSYIFSSKAPYQVSPPRESSILSADTSLSEHRQTRLWPNPLTNCVISVTCPQKNRVGDECQTSQIVYMPVLR